MRERERERERTHTHTDMTGVEGKCVVKGATNKYKCRKKRKTKTSVGVEKRVKPFPSSGKGAAITPWIILKNWFSPSHSISQAEKVF